MAHKPHPQLSTLSPGRLAEFARLSFEMATQHQKASQLSFDMGWAAIHEQLGKRLPDMTFDERSVVVNIGKAMRMAASSGSDPLDTLKLIGEGTPILKKFDPFAKTPSPALREACKSLYAEFACRAVSALIDESCSQPADSTTRPAARL